MDERASRRGFVVATIFLVVIVVVADLLRQDSVIRAAWRDLSGHELPIERLIPGFKGRRPERPQRDDPQPTAWAAPRSPSSA